MAVREIVFDKSQSVTYSNIKMPNVKHNILIEPHMIFKKEFIRELKSGRKIFKWSLNEDFWRNAVKIHGSINICLDEAHTLFNARNSSSKVNRIMADFMALIRRILGSSEAGNGTLTLITQLDRRIDVIAREQANQICWCKCYYKKTCKKCGHTWNEDNEMPETLIYCPKCDAPKKFINKHSHVIEQWKFQNIQAFEMWKMFGRKTKVFYSHILIHDIEEIFPMYNTLQWEYLSSSIYSEMEQEE
jgi:hypothetical protein